MAEKERLTNKERRELARQERKAKAEEEAKAAKRRQLVSILSTVLVLAVIGTVVYAAVMGGDEIEDTIVLNASEVADAREAAGCEEVATEPVPPPYTHFEVNQAPPADQLYSDPRPVNSGPHTNQTYPVISGGSSSQIPEVQTTHNLEHGALIGWYDPEQLDGGSIDAMEDWSAKLMDSGFSAPRGGVGIFVSPYTDPGISSGKAIAFRAWGYSLDCDEWDEDVANAFVLERYGTHGIAPERGIAQFPEELIRYEDQDVDDTSTEEAPLGDRHGEDATEEPTDGATDGATEEPTPEPTGTATE